MRETGYMGNPANIVRVRFLLDWRNCSVSAVGSVRAVGKLINPIHGALFKEVYRYMSNMRCKG